MDEVAPTAFKTPDFDDLNNNNINNNLNNNNINNAGNNSIINIHIDNNNQNNINNELNNNRINNQNENNNVVPKFIKSKDFKLLYKNKSFINKVSLSSDKKYIYIQINEDNNTLYYYEIKLNFTELQKFDKIFKTCEDLEEAYASLILIFNNEKTIIKEINRNKLTIDIFILNLDTTYHEKKIELLQKFKIKNMSIGDLYTQVNELKKTNIQLEKEIKDIKLENEKIKGDFNNFKNEMSELINELKNKINKLESNPPIKLNSDIVKLEDLDFVIERLKKVNLNDSNQNINLNISNIVLVLLYRATKDGDDSKIFHLKCDDYKNTLVLVKTKKGLRFGGFTCETWDGNGIDKKDKNAFCFSLDKRKIYNSIEGKNAIFACPDFGPAFENCIFEIKDKCFEFGGLCSDESQKYFDNHEKVCEINNGEEQFDVEDIEVFCVLFEKED